MPSEPVATRGATPVLVFILIAAATLRLWGLAFGFPHVLAHPDEVRVVHTGVEFLSGNLDPGFFNYPTLFMYAIGALDVAYCGVRIASGHYPSLSSCAASWPSTWEPFFMLARALSACAGVFTVWLLWRVGRRLLDDDTGLAGAAFLAVAFLHVRDSHFGVTDAAMTALVVAAFLLLLRAHDHPGRVRFALAGFVAGLATATKYSAALLALTVVTSAALAWRANRRSSVPDRRVGEREAAHGETGVVSGPFWRVPIYGVSMVAGFLLGTPYALLAPARFWADVSGEAAHLTLGHGMVLDVGWRYHFVVTLWHGLTWPLLMAGVIGLLLVAARHAGRAVLLLSFPLAYYVVAGRGMTVFARYMLPVLPFLCLSAGYGAIAAGRKLGRVTGASARVAGAALVLLIGSGSLVKSIELDRLLARTDSRVVASAWLLQHAPAGSSIYLSGSNFGRPELAPHGSGPGYVTASFDDTRGVFRAAGADLPAGPDFIVIQQSPLVMYSSVPVRLEEWLERYELQQTVRAFDERESRVYDQQDAFYLPLANFRQIGRPGPNILLYVRRR